MRRIAFAAFILLASTPLASSAESKGVSDILKSTGELMKERKYKEAQQIIVSGLKNDKNSYKLWLALGYVLEADSQFEKALKAFYQARELKTNITGLPERITRLENLLNSPGSNLLDKEKAEAASMLARARYYVATKSIKKGLLEFAGAVSLDRSILGSERQLIELGQEFFANPDSLLTTEEKTYYLGLYSFFAGNYEEAAKELNSYISSFPTGTNVATAKLKLEEIATLESQIKSMEAQSKLEKQPEKTVKAPKAEETAKPSTAQTPPQTEAEAVASYVAPQVVDEYANLDSEQLYSEAMAIAEQRPLKAIGILGRAIKSGNAQPDCYQSLADLYASRKGFEKDAISTYREIMEKFPGTRMAEDAKQKILKLNPSPEQRAKEVSEHFTNK